MVRESSSSSLREIERLRAEIERLQRAENGQSQSFDAEWPSSRRPPSIKLTQDRPAPRRRSSAARYETAVKTTGYRIKRAIAAVLCLAIVVASGVGIYFLVRFLQDRNVDFRLPGSGENNPTTFAELAAHNTKDDCWVALHGNVYDLTEYARRHPGGSRWVTDLAGTDGTKEYSDFHSEGLLKQVQQYKIGPLVEGDGGMTATDSSGKDSGGSGGLCCSATNTEDGCTECIAMDQVALHDQVDDCWVVLHGNVYDLTEYAKVHPGGSRLVTSLAGRDGTEAYDRHHSKGLLRDVADYLLGPIETRDGTPGGTEVTGEQTYRDSDEDSDSSDESGEEYSVEATTTTTTTSNSPTTTTTHSGTGTGGDSTTTSTAAATTTTLCAECISLTEVARHNTADDCWVVLHGNVYDLTTYAGIHPGGGRVIRNLAGTDGTTAYQRHHSRGLLQDVEEYLMGPLASTGSPEGITNDGTNVTYTAGEDGGSGDSDD